MQWIIPSKIVGSPYRRHGIPIMNISGSVMAPLIGRVRDKVILSLNLKM